MAPLSKPFTITTGPQAEDIDRMFDELYRGQQEAGSSVSVTSGAAGARGPAGLPGQDGEDADASSWGPPGNVQTDLANRIITTLRLSDGTATQPSVRFAGSEIPIIGFFYDSSAGALKAVYSGAAMVAFDDYLGGLLVVPRIVLDSAVNYPNLDAWIERGAAGQIALDTGGNYGGAGVSLNFATDAQLKVFTRASGSTTYADLLVGAFTASGAISGASLITTGAISGASLSVTGTGVIGTTLTVTGAMSGASLITTGAISGATLTSTGATVVGTTLTVTGAISGASASTTGAVVIGTTLTVTGAISGASLSTTGAAVIGTTLTSTGAISGASLTVTGTLVASGAVTARDTLTVTGAISGASLTTTGAAVVGTTLTVTGAISGASLSVTGACNLSAAGAGQIIFPATQNASANVNTLDDYEEGTWTPVLTFVTPGNLSVVYSAQTGSYTKIGQQVRVDFYIQTTTFTHSSAAGNLNITGLPFASPATYYHTSASQFQGITKSGYTNFITRVPISSSLVDMIAGASASGASQVAAADMPSSGTVQILGNVIYRV